jgi:hypothetical protein
MSTIEKTKLQLLHDDLLYMGFGRLTELPQLLEEQVSLDLPSFELFAEAFFDAESKMEATLYFRKGPSEKYGERYYFNRYEAMLRYLGAPDKDRGQTFYLQSGRGFTFKEAFNLLQGRWVCKTVIPNPEKKLLIEETDDNYSSWFRLDFTSKTRKGNYYLRYWRGKFDLEGALEVCQIRELDVPGMMDKLCKLLRKGNLPEVHFRHKNGKFEKKLITADPEAKMILNYPAAMWAERKRKTPEEPVELPGLEPAESEEISEAVLEDDLARPFKKAHL